MPKKSLFSLLGEQYLDSQHDRRYLAGLEAELSERGIVGWRRWFLEYIAASGLWWNIFWWQWCELNGTHVRRGWLQNVLVFGLAATTATLLWGALTGLATLLALHLLTTWIGFGLRQGSKLDH